VFKVASVQSDTSLTLAQVWPTSCGSQTGITQPTTGWLATWEGNKNCGANSLATYCEGGPVGDRNLTHDIHAAYSWIYKTTATQKYLTWAQSSLADYGGPAGGPGSIGPGAGPLADGSTGNFADPLPGCNVSGVPCGGLGVTNVAGKSFGMSAGAGNAPNALAYLAMSGTVAPPPPTDTTAPTASLVTPTSNTTIAGTVSITASASDNVGVTKVELYVDNVLKATDITTPYNFSLDTTSLTNSTHNLSVKAYDAAGNVGTSGMVMVDVSNVATPPPDTTA